MINDKKLYESAMRTMIRRVQSAHSACEIDSHSMSIEDAEILSDCIKAGYVNGTIMYYKKDECRMSELRTMDGKIHPRVTNTVITAAGLDFLRPKRDWKFIVPTAIALLELVVIIIQTIQIARG